MNKRKEFRQVVQGDQLIVRPSIQDALTAKLAEQIGFDVIAVSGLSSSLTTLGLPDSGYLTLPETLDQARRIANAVEVPVTADFDTGYGNALNARRATKEAIKTTDLAGIRIEDQRAPKRCGHVSGKRIVSREEAAGKFRAVCDVRDELDEDFVIIARTDARGAVDGHLDEAIDRANLYADIGADIVFVEAPTSVDEVERIADEVDAPLVYNNLTAGNSVSPLLDHETLEEFGYDLVVYLASITPTMVSVYDHLKGLQENGAEQEITFQEQYGDHPVADIFEFAGFDEIRKLENKYLPENKTEKYEQSVGHDLTEK